VLVGVLAFHFSKPGPQRAVASSGGASEILPLPASTETPETVIKSLTVDPTAELLSTASVEDPVLSNVPRNPFSMSKAWIKKLQPEPVVAPEPVKAQPQPKPQVVTLMPKAPLVPLKIEDYRLEMIYRQGDKLTAVINGKFVSAGMMVDKARILDINNDGVTLQNSESPEAPPIKIMPNR